MSRYRIKHGNPGVRDHHGAKGGDVLAGDFYKHPENATPPVEMPKARKRRPAGYVMRPDGNPRLLPRLRGR